jgi:hypothetical protein
MNGGEYLQLEIVKCIIPIFLSYAGKVKAA